LNLIPPEKADISKNMKIVKKKSHKKERPLSNSSGLPLKKKHKKSEKKKQSFNSVTGEKSSLFLPAGEDKFKRKKKKKILPSVPSEGDKLKKKKKEIPASVPAGEDKFKRKKKKKILPSVPSEGDKLKKKKKEIPLSVAVGEDKLKKKKKKEFLTSSPAKKDEPEKKKKKKEAPVLTQKKYSSHVRKSPEKKVEEIFDDFDIMDSEEDEFQKPKKQQSEEDDIFDDFEVIDEEEDLEEEIVFSETSHQEEIEEDNIEELLQSLEAEDDDMPPPEIDEDKFSLPRFFSVPVADKADDEVIAFPEFSLEIEPPASDGASALQGIKPGEEELLIDDVLKESYGKVEDFISLSDEDTLELQSTYSIPALEKDIKKEDEKDKKQVFDDSTLQ